MPQDPHPLIGRTLAGRYRVERILGMGGMGVVSEVTHLRLGRRFALKTLHAGAMLDPDSVERFRREAQVTARLGHPHIVEVTDFDTAETGEPFVVMELLVGQTLGKRLEAGPLDAAAAVAVGYQVVRALRAAHAGGVVHRDLKPDNVFLCANGSWPDFVKVLDFGMSKIRDAVGLHTQSSALLGTPRYMSPEQAMGRSSQCDERTDVFALGVILWEALAGRPAFDAAHVPGVLQAVCSIELAPLSTLRPAVPQSLAEVVARATSKRPGDRFQDVASFGTALIEALPNEERIQVTTRFNLLSQPSHPNPAAAAVDLGRTLPSTPTKRRRRRVLAVSLAAGALVVSAGTAALLYGGERRPEPPAATVAAVPTAPAPEARPAEPIAPPASPTELPEAPRPTGAAKPRPASLVVASKTLSKVYLDGRMVDETPAVLTGLAPGNHVLRIVGSLDASCERTLTLRLLEGEQRRVVVDCPEHR